MKSLSYHETIEDLLIYILSKEKQYVLNLDQGNAFDKIMRNYHQFNRNGEKVYRNLKRMKEHYRYSQKAWRARDNKSKLYFEHLVPISKLKPELFALAGKPNLTHEAIRSIMDMTEIVVITKDEAAHLDSIYKTELPNTGDRLSAVGIELEKITEKNKLF